MLSCSWDGGIPKALLWWEGPGGQKKSGEESSNILVLSFGTARNDRAYTCYAQHPLLAQHKTCLVTLVSVSKPILTLRDVPVEGSTIRMRCSVKNGTEPIQYMWQRQTLNGNFSTFSEGNQSFILMTYINRNHTGWYRCVVSNAVNTESSDPFWLDISFGPDNPQINISPNPMMDRIYTTVELENEYVTLETQAVSLLCQAQSNPPGQYIWFFNNSQIHNSSQLTIPKILRNHTGNYTCSAQNIHLNTSSSRTINLTVYYPPAGSPSCSMEPARNHSSLRLICSWSGGFPSPVLHWRGDLVQNLSDARQQTNLLSTSAILLPSGGKTLNTSLSTCVGSHPALKQLTECSTRTFIPSAELQCFAQVTDNKKDLMLSCSWDGGAPKAFIWWEGPGGQNKGGEESSNVMLIRYDTAHFEKPYTCFAQHPLLLQPKTCRLTLVPVSKPNLLVTWLDAPEEGSTMSMRCNVATGAGPIQYMWQRDTPTGDFTSFAEGNSIIINKVNRSFTGWYRCVASNSISSESSDPLRVDIIFGPDDPQIDVTPKTVLERGYTALEKEAVSLVCQAQSNPASQYIWFYNNSQITTGPQLTITKILRVNAGDYTCLAQNTFLKTRSKRAISLTVYYPPDGSPICSVEPALNYTSLKLICSWPGGFPSPALQWKGDLVDQLNSQDSSTILLPPGGLIPNNSLFSCVGSHPALKQQTECSTRTLLPPAEPLCFAYVTNSQQQLMLSCSWDGGAPKAFVWWEGPGGQSKGGQENSNILVLRYGTARSGEPYICYAQHPLLIQPKTCRLTLEAPVLLTQRRVISVYEGTDVQLTCNLRANYLPVNEITWFNNRGADIRDTSKYMLLRTSAWANLTVRDTDETQDSGEYRCSTSNAVGGAEINVTLVVKKYPMPPNATLIRVMYNSRQRQQVEAEWQVESGDNGGWTGFFLEYRKVSERPGKRGGSNSSQQQVQESAASQDWYRIIIQDPETRSHTVYGLIPTVTYQFRITAVNYHTFGHPSAVKIPGEQKHDVYPTVIGAAVGGMIFAAILMSLLLVYIVRNRNNNPRLHDMLFGSQHSRSRENINFPEDEVVGRSEGGKD
ncbi:V-set and immunoglobulin domain-containing protein 10-like 2 [Oryzias latipes]|uniref:V-set and immunoglobulin domain-containing protein 10-like 2 n=1 Tax=Oryzias latipes TaxID=8090 RepID=UPI000CE1FD70|nr:V-set and immunoglobulin domain-containing protein 10-like 2 [Oryzias latipes]